MAKNYLRLDKIPATGHIESVVSLMVIGGVLLISVILSVMFPDKKEDDIEEELAE